MKDNWKLTFMDVAERFAQESYATRLQVGAIVVKHDRIISIGINGMPSGWENVCEDRIYLKDSTAVYDTVDDVRKDYPHDDDHGPYNTKSKIEVLHAERNALDKLARSTESGDGSVMFVTHSPCIECAKSIYGAGITELYYRTDYKSLDGVKFLEKCGILVTKLDK